jgi:hypothetical protein
MQYYTLGYIKKLAFPHKVLIPFKCVERVAL